MCKLEKVITQSIIQQHQQAIINIRVLRMRSGITRSK